MKFLLATDGSAGADGARELLLGLPYREHDQVFVVAVPVYGGMAPPEGAETFGTLAWERDYVEHLVTRTRQDFASRGVMGLALVREGPVAATVLATAREVAADLVVVGSRGLGRIAGTLLGSVAQAVARDSDVPVLVVRERRVAPRRILAAVDGSADSTAALDLLGALPLPADTELTLLHVCEPQPLLGDDVDPALEERTHRLTRERATRILAHASSRLPTARVTNAYCEEGRAAEEILGKARANGADLIVLGARGMTLRGGFLHGSVTDRLLNEAPCCVLVVKSPAAAPRVEVPARVTAAAR